MAASHPIICTVSLLTQPTVLQGSKASRHELFKVDVVPILALQLCGLFWGAALLFFYTYSLHMSI